MDTTIVYWGSIGVYKDSGRENGNYCIKLGI